MTASTHSYADIVRNTERLTGVAMHHVDDENEARWLIHRVMLGAMQNTQAPTSPDALDAALAVLLTEHRPRWLNEGRGAPSIDHNRAATLIEKMEKAGIISEANAAG